MSIPIMTAYLSRNTEPMKLQHAFLFRSLTLKLHCKQDIPRCGSCVNILRLMKNIYVWRSGYILIK